jgi:hypothetical protein
VVTDVPPLRPLRPFVGQALLDHGLSPGPATSVELLRTQVRDLYLIEIRRLREAVRRRDFPMSEYAGRVVALRGRYPLLSLPLEHWYEPAPREPLR